MTAACPDHHDVDIILKLYDLRREEVMRQSRDAINGKFWPKTYQDFFAVTEMGHPMNAAWRQVTTFWEMVYGFARYGTVHTDLLMESNGEGIFLYAKIAPFIEQFRKESSPTAFQHTEWVIHNSKVAQGRFEMMRARIEKVLAKM